MTFDGKRSVRRNGEFEAGAEGAKAVIVLLSIEELEILLVEEADAFDNLLLDPEAEAVDQRHARQEVRVAPRLAGPVEVSSRYGLPARG